LLSFLKITILGILDYKTDWVFLFVACNSPAGMEVREMQQLFSIYLKFFFLLTPFFLLSTFLAMTREMTADRRKRLAVKTTFAVLVISLILFVSGDYIFQLFGITLNSFRIGTGVLLMLSAISLVSGNACQMASESDDIAVVPLAIPVTVGPATTGALLIMGGELKEFWERALGLAGIFAAIVSVGGLIYVSGSVERILKRQGLNILSKITGLILAALAAQMVMSGIIGFLSGNAGDVLPLN
jgi:multiple antibiotic resistance protein